MKKFGFNLIEVLVASAVLGIMMLSTIDFMSKFISADTVFNQSITNKREKIDLSERISSTLKPASYIYKSGVEITIPTQNASTEVINNSNSIAVLIPKFNTDGTLEMAGGNVTKFTGVIFSIIPQSVWDGSSSNKYVLVQTVFDNPILNIATDTNDPLELLSSPTTDWTEGDSFVLADDFKPALTLNMGQSAFKSENPRDKIKYTFIPKSDGTYFPSVYGKKTIDDSQYLMSVALRNWRETPY